MKNHPITNLFVLFKEFFPGEPFHFVLSSNTLDEFRLALHLPKTTNREAMHCELQLHEQGLFSGCPKQDEYLIVSIANLVLRIKSLLGENPGPHDAEQIRATVANYMGVDWE